MKFVVAPMGSAGDVHPLVGVGKSLEARGHDVVMVVLAGMSGSSERAGLRTIRVGNEQQFEAILHDPDLWHPRRAFGLIAQWIPLVAREMMAALGPELDGKETVMVAGGLAFGARALGEARGVPVVTMQLQPMVFMSAQEMPVMVAGGEWMRGMPQWARRMFFRMVNWQIDRLLRKSVNEIQREAGATGKVKGIFREWWHSPDGVVGLFPDWFAAKASDWPKQAVTTRFVLYDEGEVRAADPELEAFLAGGGGGGGGGPVVITPGSANVQAGKFLREAIEGVRRIGKRAVIVTRTAEHLPKRLPEGILWREYVPFGRLFERASAVVHHGGIGTTAQCFAAGAPQLIMPMAHDQPDNASRVKRLGCGTYLYPKKFVAKEIGRVLEGLMGSITVRESCVRVKGLMEKQIPMEEVAGIIEKMGQKTPEVGARPRDVVV